MNLKTIIIDDEHLAIKIIQNYLKEFEEISVVGCFENALEANSFLENNSVDLCFLDINMPLLDGISFLENLETKPIVILTTAHQEYAVKGYDLEVLDFLTKPISFPRFMKSIKKAIRLKSVQTAETKEISEEDHLFVKVDKKRMHKILLEDILYVESLKDYVKIITEEERFIVHTTLTNFLENLPKDKFIRIHRSFIVSIPKVQAVEGNTLEIKGKKYTIGRNYLKEVKSTILKMDYSDTESYEN